jgi:MarR family transcriptional regulator, organic hydroperoxide resistance regulator
MNQKPTEGFEDREVSRSVIRQLRMIIRALQGHSHNVERACGITAAQLWALWELHRSPGLKVSELARRLSVHASTASNLLDKLEQGRLVERQRRERDQRIVRLYVTAAGEALIARAPAAPQGELNRALETMEPEQRQALDRALSALISHMGAAEPQAGLRPLDDRG